jgi:hypothetical protein
MATNEVEIEVVLEGAQQATKELKNIGQAGKSVAESMRTTNEKLGEGFTSVADGVESVVESVGGFSKALSSASTAGAAGLSSLLGPVALLTTGVVALYEAFRSFSGASQEAEARAQAMAAAASDLQTKLESLAERGVNPSTEQIKEFTKANLQAQIQKELLQVQMERSTKVFQRFTEASESTERAQKALDDALKAGNLTATEELELRGALGRAMALEKKATEELDKTVSKFTVTQLKVSKSLKDTEEKYKALEETSKESLQTKAKEEIARLKNIKLLALEASDNQKNNEALKAEIEAESKLLEIRAKSEDTTALKALNEELKKSTQLAIERSGAVDEAALTEVAGIQQAQRLREATNKKEREELQKKRDARQKAADQRRAMEQRQAREAITSQARLQALEIQLTEEGYTKQVKLATLAYNTELQLAEDNATKKAEAELRYQLKLKEIGQARIDQSAKEAQKIEQDRLKAEAQAAKERDARERQAEAERQRRIEQAKADYQDLMSAVDHYSSGLANAAAGALLFGDSVSQGVADALNALASEAAVNALIETAKGVASAFTNPAESATHFTAAGQFAVAATAARGASALLGGGGGGGVTAGASASPSGAPQTASAPIREEARESQIVYNINFGSSVIYDSKRAAEQALADRITTIQNTRRRGAPIPRRA